MSWIKYTVKWAHGYGWHDYIEISNLRPYTNENGTIDFEEIVLDYDLDRECRDSDKYRGMDCELINLPPREYLEGLLKGLERRKKVVDKRIEELQYIIKWELPREERENLSL